MTSFPSFCIFLFLLATFSTDIEPPVVTQCPVPILKQVNAIPVQVTWIEPMFADNVAVTKVKTTAEPGLKIYSWGRTDVTYTAKDRAGNKVECVVFIDVVDCKYKL